MSATEKIGGEAGFGIWRVQLPNSRNLEGTGSAIVVADCWLGRGDEPRAADRRLYLNRFVTWIA